MYPLDITPPCRYLTDQFFDRRTETQTAKLCEHCPIIDECRTYAYEHQIEFGVWGGTTSQQRRHDFLPECIKGCGNKARWDHKTCKPCGTPGRPRKQLTQQEAG